MFLSGITFAAILPYGAVVGIEVLGLSNSTYAIIVGMGAAISALVSLSFGYASDIVRDRRLLILFCAAVGFASYLVLYLLRSPIAFVLVTCLTAPIAAALFSQLFSYARTYYDLHDPARASFMVSILRTVFAVAWIIVPPFVGFYVTNNSIFEIYIASSLAYFACACFVLIGFRSPRLFVPRPKRAAQEEAAGRHRGFHAGVLSGIFGLTLIKIAMVLTSTVMPLAIINNFGGQISDIGLFAGLVAALEVPFMIAWAFLGTRISKEAILTVNGFIFAAFVGLAAVSGNMGHIFVLAAMNALAASALLSIQISYLQEVIRGRVGLSTSLSDLVGIVSSFAAATLFGVLTASGNYRLALVAASTLCVIGSASIVTGNLRRIFPTVKPSGG